MNNSYALITGATSGIGLEISKDLAKRGFNLILVARTIENLVQTSNYLTQEYDIKCDYFSSDLTLIDSPDEIYQFTSQKKYDVDILVNNAGYALPNAFHKNTMEDEEKCLRVLGTSVIALTKKYINDMISKGGGKIMIVSSVAAFAPASSLQSLYGPVKTFMNRFVEAINSAYNKDNIYATSVCPGFTTTEFHEMSGTQDRMDKVPSFMKMSSDAVAKEGILGMDRKKEIVITGSLNRF